MSIDISSYKISEFVSVSQIPELIALFDLRDISHGRRESDVQIMLDHSDLVVICQEPDKGRIVGVARVLTDYIYKAWIMDVRVETHLQGKGVGRAMIRHILNHPSLARVHNFELLSFLETVDFYRGLGFESVEGKLDHMRFTRT